MLCLLFCLPNRLVVHTRLFRYDSLKRSLIPVIRLTPLENSGQGRPMVKCMKEKIGIPNGKQLGPAFFLILFLGWSLPWGLGPLLCVGAEKGARNAPFSISATNERLDVVLDKISKASGYTITVNEGWRNKATTVRLENVTLEEGLKALIDALGKPSHLLLYDQTQKKVDIVMIPGSSTALDSSVRPEPQPRSLRQIGPVGPERSVSPQARPVPRRTRQRVIPPPTSPGQVQEPGREEPPVVQPEPETKVGEAPGAPEEASEEGAADSKRKEGPERSRKTAEPSEDNPDSSGS